MKNIILITIGMLLLANAGCKQLEILKFWAKETSDDMAKETSDDNCVRPPLTIVDGRAHV